MKPKINQQQTDWLAETEELDDIEASQVNGGNPIVNAPSLSVEDKVLLLLQQMMKELDEQIKKQTSSVRP